MDFLQTPLAAKMFNWKRTLVRFDALEVVKTLNETSDVPWNFKADDVLIILFDYVNGSHIGLFIIDVCFYFKKKSETEFNVHVASRYRKCKL